MRPVPEGTGLIALRACSSCAWASSASSPRGELTMQFIVILTTICIVNAERDVLRAIGQAPMRTVRAADLEGIYTHPVQQFAILLRRGVVHRLTHGTYCLVPHEQVGPGWRPPLEAATAAVATALYGDRVPVLMGLSAARVQRALPRAIGTGYVAVPTQRRPLRFADREGGIPLIIRDVVTLDAVLVQTDLGPTLATTPEPTVLDLARADPRGQEVDARDAIRALWPECDQQVLAEIAGRQRMRTTLERLKAGR